MGLDFLKPKYSQQNDQNSSSLEFLQPKHTRKYQTQDEIDQIKPVADISNFTPHPATYLDNSKPAILPQPIIPQVAQQQAIQPVHNDAGIMSWLYNTPIGSRIGAAAGMENMDGTPIKPVGDTNLLGKIFSGAVGGLGNMLAMGGGGNAIGSGFGAGENLVNNLLEKNTGKGIEALSNLAQYGTKAATGGTELGTFSGLDTAAQGGSKEDVAKSVGLGFLQGAGLNVLGKGLGDIAEVPGFIKDAKNAGYNQAIESKLGKIDNPIIRNASKIDGTFKQEGSLVPREGLFQLPAPRGVNVLPSGDVIPMGGRIENVNPLVRIKKIRTETPIESLDKYNGKYTVKNEELSKAQQHYDEAIRDIQNQIGHYKLTDDEILDASIKLGIDPFKLVDNINKVSKDGIPNLDSIGERAKLARVSGLNDNIPKLKKTNVNINSEPVFSGYKGQKVENPMLPKTPFDIAKSNDVIAKRLSKLTGRPIDEIKTELNTLNSTIENKGVLPQYAKENPWELPQETVNTEIKQTSNSGLKDKSGKDNIQTNPIDGYDIDNWKDKGKFALNRETMERNLQDIAGKDAPKLIKDYIDPIKTSEATSIREKNTMRDTVKTFGVKAGSYDSSLMQKYGEGLISLDELKQKTSNWKNVKAGADYMRKTYDELINKANESLTRNNMKPIPKRSNYMPHQGEMDSIMKTLGLETYDLPTDINGITAQFKPNKNWFGNALQRKGNQTVYDAVRGFDNYIEGVQRIIHHTDNIVRLRKLDKAIRGKFEDTGSTHLSNFVSSLTDYTNLLAGKKSELDRGFESTVGRNVYRAADGIRKQVASNMIGANVSSALTNFIPLTQSLATTNKQSFIKAMMDTIGSRLTDDGFSNKSDFLTRREGSDKLALNSWQKVQTGANWIFKVVDNFVGETITRAKYYEGLKKGMPEEQAMKYADDWAGKVMADRSIGMTPALMNSKVISLFAPFQTEVNNQMSFLLKDLPREYLKDGANVKSIASLGSALGQIALYSYLFNNLYENIIGRRPAFDVIGIAEKAKNDFTNSRLAPGQAQKNLAKNIADQLPFSSVVTGGRIPIGSALPDVYGLATGESDLKTELTKPLTYLLPPTGGGQIKKTLQGLQSINNKGVYKGDKLQNPVDTNTLNSIKGLLFGNSAFNETKDFYNNNKQPLSSNQTEMYKAANGIIPLTPKLKEDMSSAGYNNMTGKDLYNKVSDERDIQKEKDKLYKLIDAFNVTDKAKSKDKEYSNKVISDMKNASKTDIIKKIKELQNHYKGL